MFTRIFAPCLLLCALWVSASYAQEEAAPAANDAAKTAFTAAMSAMVRGPQTIELEDQAKLALPEGYGFVPKAPAADLMRAVGNTIDERFIGLVMPLAEREWFVTVEYEASGYIKDDEAKEWDADGLLANLKEGTESANEQRKERGIPAIQVTRWIEPPAYDANVHHLVWSAEIKLKDGDDLDPGVNYNTYVLGREGYVSLNLVTALSTVEADKPAARELLQAVTFNPGKSYSDFDASTDKVAAYGLAALVGGLAAKKLGLLAVIAAFLAKFSKIIIVVVVAFGGVIARFFKRKTAA